MSYYDDKAPTCTVDVLGTEYRVFLDVPESADATLKEAAGYCDESSHMIAICRQEPEDDIDDFEAYRRRILRHELIHAFMFESGLGGDAIWWPVDKQRQPEQTVDWLARQFPKMLKAFQQVGAL